MTSKKKFYTIEWITFPGGTGRGVKGTLKGLKRYFDFNESKSYSCNVSIQEPTTIKGLVSALNRRAKYDPTYEGLFYSIGL